MESKKEFNYQQKLSNLADWLIDQQKLMNACWYKELNGVHWGRCSYQWVLTKDIRHVCMCYPVSEQTLPDHHELHQHPTSVAVSDGDTQCTLALVACAEMHIAMHGVWRSHIEAI